MKTDNLWSDATSNRRWFTTFSMAPDAASHVTEPTPTDLHWLATAVTAVARISHAHIPTADLMHAAADVGAQIETISQWWLQLRQMAGRIESLRAPCTAVDTRSPEAKALSDWSMAMESVRSTETYLRERQKFTKMTLGSKTNALYDVIASQKTIMSDFFEQVNSELAAMKDLSDQIASTASIALKAELTRRLARESFSIQERHRICMSLQQHLQQDLISASTDAAVSWQLTAQPKVRSTRKSKNQTFTFAAE